MMIVLLVIVLILPPSWSGVVAIGLSIGFLVHHEIQRSQSGRPVLQPRAQPSVSDTPPSAVGPRSIMLPGGALVVGGLLAMGVSWQPGEGMGLESAKLVASGLALLAGSSILRPDRGVRRVQLWLSVALMVLVVIDTFLIGVTVNSLGPSLSPPFGNSAAVLVCFLAPVALGDLRPRSRVPYLALMSLFGFAIFSRFVIGAVVVLIAREVGRDRVLRFASLGAISLVVFGPQFRGLSFGNFSDQLRLRIWEVSFERIADNYGLLIGKGEQRFIEHLHAEPFYRDLEVSHAHNLALHVWNSYGLIVTVLWVGALALLIRSLWGIDVAFTAQLIALVAVAQLEAVVTDARNLLVVFFFLGLRWRSLTEDQETVSAVSANRLPRAGPITRQRRGLTSSST